MKLVNALISVFDGWLARIVLHELDHLAGIMYIDHMLTYSFCHSDFTDPSLSQNLSDISPPQDIVKNIDV